MILRKRWGAVGSIMFLQSSGWLWFVVIWGWLKGAHGRPTAINETGSPPPMLATPLELGQA